MRLADGGCCKPQALYGSARCTGQAQLQQHIVCCLAQGHQLPLPLSASR